jgi:CheY-like chemotaxis protein
MSTRILVVDDSPSFRQTAVDLLHAQGFQLFAAVGDGAAAHAAMTGEQPDGVLLDVNLPGLDGFTVAGSLTSRYPGLRIVLTSSDCDGVPPESLAAVVAKTEAVAADLQQLFAIPPGTSAPP